MNVLKTEKKLELCYCLISNVRRRFHHALKGESKTSSTMDMSGIDMDSY